MKKSSVVFITVLGTAFLIFIFSCNRIDKRNKVSVAINSLAVPVEEDFPVLKGPYLGQKPPGNVPEMFAPGIVSQFVNELNSCFSPDGNEFYYSKRRGLVEMDIYVMKRKGDIWGKPHILSFITEEYNECDPFVASDGNRLFFSSDRARQEGGEAADWNIWMSTREGEDWGKPVLLNFNTEWNEVYPTLTENGKLYFYADYRRKIKMNTIDSVDIYYTSFSGGKYGKPQMLDDSINTLYNEFDPFIAADESYIIFARYIPEDFNYGDLYISFRKKDGSWTEARNMGPDINSNRIESNVMLSHDGKYLFFTSFKRTVTERPEIDKYLNGLGNIFWVDSKVIQQFNPSQP